MGTREHWEKVYTQRSPESVSWYQAEPAASLALIERAGTTVDAPVIDVGGGASLLVDRLLDRGFTRVTVLDVSASALAHARRRLGPRAAQATWVEGDVTGFRPPERYALWHDRAVFHFLQSPAERDAYARVLAGALAPGGQALIATFAPDGPERCSGLPVRRYDEQAILAALGAGFELLETRPETHLTPAGAEQRFRWFRLALAGAAAQR